MTKKLNFIYAVGKRRSSSARIRLFHGKGDNTVNGILLEKYFPGIVNESKWVKPFGVTETSDKYYFTSRVIGGGKQGQLDAVVHGLAKALAKAKPDKFRAPLKKAGLLTRDSRIRERRKIGMGGKSRRQKQSPKR